jgi:hypothetical protein
MHFGKFGGPMAVDSFFLFPIIFRTMSLGTQKSPFTVLHRNLHSQVSSQGDASS